MSLADLTPILDDASFARLRALVRSHTGIALGNDKRQLCQTRLVRRLRALGLTSFTAYLARLDDPGSPEHGELVNAITTNVTAFFREPHHFEWLAARALPALAREPARQRLRVWSAGCSSGEEPWSLAMVLDEARLPGRWDVKVLATDIDTQILATAAAGIYPEARLEQVSAARRKRYLVRAQGPDRGAWQIGPTLHERVRFRALNLFAAWPMKQQFDVIFCRNVIIYFDAESRTRLITRFVENLAPGGHLVLGHSESLLGDVRGLTPAGKTIYRKVAS
jgi:chemotaxis protein methyltransferase CheR